MSATDSESAVGSDTAQLPGPLIEEWVQNLAQLLDAMTGQKARVEWRAASGVAAEIGAVADANILWWELPFPFDPQAIIWIGTPRITWESTAGLLSKAAGLESPPEDEARRTWQEILGQWTAALARTVGSQIGKDVACGLGAEHEPPDGPHEWAGGHYARVRR